MAIPPKSSGNKAQRDISGRPQRTTDWAGNLRKMYDEVVAEPLPDSFTDLLAKLDEAASNDPKS